MRFGGNGVRGRVAIKSRTFAVLESCVRAVPRAVRYPGRRFSEESAAIVRRAAAFCFRKAEDWIAATAALGAAIAVSVRLSRPGCVRCDVLTAIAAIETNCALPQR